METLKIVNYNHSRKTASFVRVSQLKYLENKFKFEVENNFYLKACVAYSFITIPSLSNPILKLQLYLESSHVALINQCLSQCKAFRSIQTHHSSN
jgi:hypothetical protein